MERPKSKTKSPDQHKKFAQAARELGCDDSETAFDRKLKKIAKAAPPKAKKAARKPKG